MTYENDDFFSDDPNGGGGTSDYINLRLSTRYQASDNLSFGASISSSTQNSNNTNDEALSDFENWIFSINANYIFW